MIPIAFHAKVAEEKCVKGQLIKADDLRNLLEREQGRARIEIVPLHDGPWVVSVKVAATRYILSCSDSKRMRIYHTMLGGVRRSLRSFPTPSGIWVLPSEPIEGCNPDSNAVA